MPEENPAPDPDSPPSRLRPSERLARLEERLEENEREVAALSEVVLADKPETTHIDERDPEPGDPEPDPEAEADPEPEPEPTPPPSPPPAHRPGLLW